MRPSLRLFLAVYLVLVLPGAGYAAPLLHHELKVRLLPDGHSIAALDRVTLPAPSGDRRVFLDPALARTLEWRDDLSFTASYEGLIDNPLTQVGQEAARGQRETVGTIGPEGVYLDGGSGWYPLVPGGWSLTFDLTVELPPGWDAVSQGTRVEHRVTDQGTTVRWLCREPQQGIWLVAGRYARYARAFGPVLAMAFFREPEEALADQYLAATGEYITMYGGLIGPYPYGKFAVVENFWETGYGMPSFTLLGPRVIRFPFIIESSFPHEILHNWWGNSVYIDYGTGNWGEGLTAYLSDHLIREQKGEGSRHRQEVLQKYADYVLEGRDLPLTGFRSRHGSVTEAVGYGKTMMLFHMLRRELGDDLFVDGLRTLYRDNLYRTASFANVRSAFEKAGERDLGRFFDQWVLRTGAPVLTLGASRVTGNAAEGFGVTVGLRQVQDGDPYDLLVPVAVTDPATGSAGLEEVRMTRKEQTFTFRARGPSARLDVDPLFDLFRRLDRKEIPPALSQAFGARRAIIVVPARAEPELRKSYLSMARFLARTGPGTVKILSDDELEGLPEDASVWLLGWDNRLLAEAVPAFGEFGCEVDLQAGSVRLGGDGATVLTRPRHSVVLAGRHPHNSSLAVLWIAAGDADAHAGLARKLPHYHKYSYLAFTGKEPENTVKGRWPVFRSPLTAFVGGTEPFPMGDLVRREPLAERPASPASGTTGVEIR